MNLKKLTTIATAITISISATVSFSAYKLYAEPNNSSKVVTEIGDNGSNFIQIYQNKDGSWKKFADTNTGQVGWVNMQDIRKHKADRIRNRMLENIDSNISYYQNHIKELKKLKTKVSVSDLKQLRDMQNPMPMFNSSFFSEPNDYMLSKSYSYTGGQNANVTETTIKNGKKETKNYTVPVE